MVIPVATVPPRLEAFARGIARNYSTPKWPESELYSIMADAIRVGARTAKSFADPSCVELCQDELEAESRRKLIELFHGRPAEGRRQAKAPILKQLNKQGELAVQTRAQLFGYVATCFNNHTRGLVHKHRFTAKRTGSKVPPKGSPELARWTREQQKPEISFDALPELRSRREFQVIGCTPRQLREVDEDMEGLLNPLEFTVWQQLTNPNETAWLLARIDSWRGRNPAEIKITFEHYAAGVGLPVEEFTRIARGVTAKFEEYRRHGRLAVPVLAPAAPERRTRLTPVEFLVYQQLVSPNARARALAQSEKGPLRREHLAYGIGLSPELFSSTYESVKLKLMDKSLPALTALETVFEVQVPRSVEPLVVRRLFTLAARAMVERVTPDVASMLRSIGAEVPERNSQNNLTCFGVLYSKNHHVCLACQARKACQAKAANFGLDMISLHPSLLSARSQVRTAEVIGERPLEALPATAPLVTEREEEITTYLEHHFKCTKAGNLVSYVHRSHPRTIVTVVRETEDTGPVFRVRFCNPSLTLRARLVKRKDSFYAPDTLGAKEMCALVERHADELFTLALAGKVKSSSPLFSPPVPAGQVRSAEADVVLLDQVQHLFWHRARRLVLELVDRLRVSPLTFRKF